jgi:hypothetical protein
MCVLVLDRMPSSEPAHSLALATLASDIMWGANVYRGKKAIGSIARLFLDQKTGAVERVEITRRLGKPPLFVRWNELLFDIDPLRIYLLTEPSDSTEVPKQTFLQRLGFWVWRVPRNADQSSQGPA